MTERTPEDEQLGRLMAAAQAGDAEAYLGLLHAVTPRLRRLVGSRRGDGAAEGIEDVVQDILLSVHAARASYDPGRPFLPWLHAIARHRLADSARRYARRTAREVWIGEPDVTFADIPANTPSAMADAVELRDAIGTLPDGQRRAIELLKLRGLSLKEAAVVTGQSVGALKVATHRAVAALRRMLVAGEIDGH